MRFLGLSGIGEGLLLRLRLFLGDLERDLVLDFCRCRSPLDRLGGGEGLGEVFLCILFGEGEY